MDISRQSQLAGLREQLTRRLHQLRAHIQAAEQADRESIDARAREVVDQKDEATQLQLSVLEEAQERRELGELAQVEAALQRLDLGTCGDCADCGEPIPVQRLLVQPAAMRCAACQANHEQVGDRSSTG
jgi:DnaK suppressor protein